MQYSSICATPWGGRLGVRDDGAHVLGIDFLAAGTPLSAAATPLARRTEDELAAYFANPSHVFSLPVRPAGTVFQLRVWQAIAAIPVGQTRRYGELAGELRSVARAVGQACGNNPLPIVIPCHRVVAAGGLGGFDHRTDNAHLDIKRWLLMHEASTGSLFDRAPQ